MSQNLQNFAKFQKFQLDSLVDFEKCCKTRIFLQKSVPIQPKTSNILPKFCQKLATTLRVRRAVRGLRALERQLDVLARPHVRGPLRSGAKARWRTHQLAKRGKTFAAFG